MKVLCIINSLGTGGAEKLVLETLPLFNEKIQVDVLLLQSGEYPFEQQLREKLPHQVFTSKYKGVYNPLHVFTIARHLRHYDVVHVHLFPAQYFATLGKVFSFSRVKLIFTEHNTSNRRLENALFRIIDKWIYRFYDKIVCISAEIQDIIARHTGLPDRRFSLIPNGVNLAAIHKAKPLIRSDFKVQVDDITVVQVSAFRKQKNQQTLIRSLNHLPDNIVVWLAGSGETMEECRQLVHELGLETRVHFLGVRTDIPELLKTADIVVLSSHYEGLSLASIEGMASGKPFVASNVPGLREVVHGAGLLFADNDAEALAKHLTDLLADEAYYNKTAAQCLERAQDFDIQHMIDQHLALYHEVNQA